MVHDPQPTNSSTSLLPTVQASMIFLTMFHLDCCPLYLNYGLTGYMAAFRYASFGVTVLVNIIHNIDRTILNFSQKLS